MRTEYLKELELLPVWQLRKPLPGLPEKPEEKQQGEASVEAPLDHNAALQETAVPAISDLPNVVTYMSEDAGLQLMHSAGDLSQEAQQLSRNIARSMRMKGYSSATLDLALQQSASVILVLGESLAQSVLSNQQALQTLRNQVHTFENKQVVVTDDLETMLGQPEVKAQVWKDCCLAMSLLAEKEN